MPESKENKKKNHAIKAGIFYHFSKTGVESQHLLSARHTLRLKLSQRHLLCICDKHELIRGLSVLFLRCATLSGRTKQRHGLAKASQIQSDIVSLRA